AHASRSSATCRSNALPDSTCPTTAWTWECEHAGHRPRPAHRRRAPRPRQRPPARRVERGPAGDARAAARPLRPGGRRPRAGGTQVTEMSRGPLVGTNGQLSLESERPTLDEPLLPPAEAGALLSVRSSWASAAVRARP